MSRELLPLTFTLSSFALLVLPGYLIISLWRRLRDLVSSRLELAALSILLSIVLQTFFCVLTFELGLSVRNVLIFELIGLILLYGAMLMTGSKTAFHKVRRDEGWDAISYFTFAAFLLLLGLGVMCYLGGGFIDREQTILTRKIAENAGAYKFDIMYLPGEPHTYLYEPLGFLIALIANATGSDVIVITDKFWALNVIFTGLFGAAFVATAVRWRMGSVIYLFFFAFSVFLYPLSDFTQTGVLMPYPNRYGFGPGVLVPAGLWLIIKFEETKRPWTLLSLIPLFLLTLTVFHAREGLLLFIVYGLFAALLFLFKESRKEILVRYGLLLFLCAVLLGLFSVYHKMNVSHVAAVTGELKSHLHEEFRQMIANPSLAFDRNYFKTFPLFVGEYELGRFYTQLVMSTRPAIIYPLMFFGFALPFLVLFVRKNWIWLAVAGFTGLLTLCYFPVLFTGISRVVGTTDLFHCITFFYGLMLVFFVSAAMEIGIGLSKIIEWVQSLWLRGPFVKAVLFAGLIAAVNGIAFGLYQKSDVLLAWQMDHPFRFYWVHVALLIASIVVLAGTHFLFKRLKPSGEGRPDSGNRNVMGCYAVMVLMVPYLWNHFAVGHPFDKAFAKDVRGEKAVNDLYLDYGRVVTRPNMHSPFSLELVKYLREKMPPLQRIVADERVATTVPLYGNQYVVHAGAPLSTDQKYYEEWHSRHKAHLLFNDQPLAVFWKDNLAFLDAYRVDYVLVDPGHRDKLFDYFQKVNSVGKVFETVFDDGSFAVVKVFLPAVQETLKKLESKVRSNEIRF